MRDIAGSAEMCYRLFTIMNVVLAADFKHFLQVIVVITSICIHNRNTHIVFYVFLDAIPRESLHYIDELEDEYDCVIFPMLADNEKWEWEFWQKRLGGAGPVSWWRLDIPEWLSNVDKVLYVDFDLVALGNWKELWDTDLGDTYLAAAVEFWATDLDEETMFTCNGKNYKNAGVLLMNCKKWREDHCNERLLGLVSTYPHIRWGDERVINRFCAEGENRCVHIDGKWNFNEQTHNEDHRVYHWFGWLKPWEVGYTLRRWLWWDYAMRSPAAQELFKLALEKGIPI